MGGVERNLRFWKNKELSVESGAVEESDEDRR